jgi:hypothetical protein
MSGKLALGLYTFRTAWRPVCTVNSAWSAADITIFLPRGGGKAEGMVMVDEARKEPDRHALRSGF